MSASFRQRKAADVVADPKFQRFASAFEAGTTARVPRQFVEERFRASDGTVDDVLRDIYTTYPRTVSLDLILVDVRRAGALEHLAVELDRLRPELEAWNAFMDGRELGPA